MIKPTCEMNIMKPFIQVLEEAFGKGELEISICTLENPVECCGVRHTMTDEGYELDQDKYLAALRPIVNEKVTTGDENAKAWRSCICPW